MTKKQLFYADYFKGIGLHKLQALSATRPQLKQMKAGFFVISMIWSNLFWLASRQICPL